MTSCSEIPSSFACSGICLSTNGVRTKPGQITLARTPCSAPSLATTRARPSRACLAETYGALSLEASFECTEPHVDDAAALLFVHLSQRGAGREEGTVEM